jgi:MarR family transcriptional regulator for hemolysin
LSAHAKPELHPGLLIYDIVRLFRQCFGARLQDLDLSEVQWRTLGTVHKFPGISQTQLAEHLDIGKAPTGAIIDKLEKAGLLERQPDPSDRRLKRLEITARALPLTATMRQRYEQLEGELLKGISVREQARLERVLRQVYSNLTDTQPQNLALMHLVIGTRRLFARHFDIQLKKLGFTRSQWLVLTAINQNQGVQQNTLASALHMQKAPLGVIVDELEKGGWVERRLHPSDRRARQLFLTTHCRQQWPVLAESYQLMHEKALQKVAENHRQQLGKNLQTIRNNLQSIAASTQHSQGKTA